jgi:hypothetical protein
MGPISLGIFKWKDGHIPETNRSTVTGSAKLVVSDRERRQKACDRHLDRGGVRKAMTSLLSTDTPVSDHAAAFDTLADLHVEVDDCDATGSRARLEVDISPISSSDLGGIIRKTVLTTAPDDVTGTRARYVKQMISDSTPDADRYLSVYTTFVNRYSVGQFSDQILALLNCGQATAVGKTDKSIAFTNNGRGLVHT